MDPTSLPGENKSVMGFNLIWMFDKVAELGDMERDLGGRGRPLARSGANNTSTSAPGRARKFQTGQTTGKVVVVVEEEERETAKCPERYDTPSTAKDVGAEAQTVATRTRDATG